MKTRPILFNAEMVRAVLDDRKTQTRRVMKPQPQPRENQPERLDFLNRSHVSIAAMWEPWELGHPRPGYLHFQDFCPYGRAGDRLWVRETWAALSADATGRRIGCTYRAEGEFAPEMIVYPRKVPSDFDWGKAMGYLGRRWRPSIHMPRWASRITLEMLSVRVERVQDITEADALAEGCQKWMEGGLESDSAQSDFAQLWNSIHDEPKPRCATVDGKRVITHYELYPWEDIRETRERRGKPWHVRGNPWVWVVEFQLLEGGRHGETTNDQTVP